MTEQKTIISKGQLLGICVSIAIAMLTSWMSVTQRIRTLEVGTEIRLQQLENQVSKNEEYYFNILTEIQDLKVALENKQNRD